MTYITKNNILTFLVAVARAAYSITAGICGIIVFNMMLTGVDTLLILGIATVTLAALTAFVYAVDMFDEWVDKRTAA